MVKENEQKSDQKHYLVSFTIKSATNLKFDEIDAGNPFCIVEVMGIKKTTLFKSRTKDPVWNERIDIVTDFKPKRANVFVKDFVYHKKFNNIGKVSVEIESKIDKSIQNFEEAILKSSPGEDAKERGKLHFQLNVKQIQPNRKHHYGWDNLLHIDIEKIFDLPLYAQCIEKYSKLQLISKIGAQKFSVDFTDPSKGINNATGFFFIDKEKMKNKSAVFSLQLDRNRQTELIGVGSFKLSNLDYEKLHNEAKVFLYLPNSPERKIGNLTFSTKMVSRVNIEKKLTESIFKEYDYDFDGRISKEEMFDMLATIRPDFNLAQSYEITQRVFRDAKGKPLQFLHKNDLLRFLHSSEMHSTPFINLLVIASLQGRPFPTTAHLLRGVTYPFSAEAESIRIKDREKEIIFDEKIPSYIKLALKTSKNYKNSELNFEVARLLPRLTERQGWHFDSRRSRNEIIPFASLHKINIADFNESVSNFSTFNAFFSRKFNKNARPITSPQNNLICISPCDCRMTVFSHLQKANQIWIKGLGLDLRGLLCDDSLAARFAHSSIALCRLAPADPHRWGAPVAGVQGKISHIKGSMQPLHPAANSLAALSRNRRAVSEILSMEFGSVLVVAVGGPMVSSIELQSKTLDKLQRGDFNGRFKFGGSTLALFFEKGRIKFDSDLIEASEKGLETFVKANSRIGVALKPEV